MIMLRRPSLQPYPEVPLPQILRQAAERYPHKVAVIHEGRAVTFAELDEQADRCAAALAALGLGKGQTIALFLPNGIPFIVAYYGALRAGAIVSPLNPTYKAREVAYQVADARAVIIVVHPDLYPVVAEARGHLSLLREVIVTGEKPPEGACSLADLLESRPPRPPAVDWDAHEDVAVLPYTSGTVGLPKGVMLTHYNLTSNIRQFLAVSEADEGDVFLNHLPFYHIYGMNLMMSAALAAGATQVIMTRFDVETFFALVERHRPTRFFTVPPVLLALTNHPDLARHDLSSLEYVNSGAAPLPPEVAARFQEGTGVLVTQGYGLTETSPVTHSNPLDRVKVASIGIPVPDTEQRIVDVETGTRDLPPGEVGELVVRGPQVMKGYWKRPGETAQVLRDGWFHTGDIARLDEEGYCYIVDRKKEMIKYKGYGVGPAELEALLHEHPAVADAAVIGVPDPMVGEIPEAFVVLRTGVQTTAEELMHFVEERIAPYKKVRVIQFVESIPRSASGKILRRVLKEAAVSQNR
jgi:long-chain acyl-CoA synthetase